AVFGELTREFLEGKFELTGGLLYFRDTISTVQLSGFTDPTPSAVTGTDDHHLSPRVILNWHPHADSTVYASYSEGFRSGGAQGAAILAIEPNFPALKPDTLKNYELGAKGDLFGGALSYDAALYYMDWKAVQQPLLVSLGAVNIQTIINSKSASGVGGELGFTFRPVTDLAFSGNFGWNGLKVDADVLSGSVDLFPKGVRLNLSPEYTAGAAATYTVHLSGGYKGNFSGTFNYISSTTDRSLNTVTNSVLISPGDATRTGNLSFALVSPQRWTASVFVDNFTNENASPLNHFVGFANWNQRIRPRTFGVQFEDSF